jgi:RNA polymerase sigma-70 factor (ECF subfamily)
MHDDLVPPTGSGEVYERLRPLMFAIAYRMLGSVSEAEDVVQEAYLRFHRATAHGTAIASPKAFLTTVTTRLAIDALRAARARRETYVGPWLPEPLLTSADSDPAAHAEMHDSLSLAFLVLLQTLSPVERAVFLLREIFDYAYDEIAAIVQKSEENCRQIFARARKRIDEGKPRFDVSQADQQQLATRFFEAVGQGDLASLVAFLAADVAFYGDGGGRARAYPQPIFGRDRVGRLLYNLFRMARRFNITVQPTPINGQPGALSFDAGGSLINVFVLDIADGAIQAVRSIVNPDKLAHLGFPLSDLLRIDHADA